MATLAATPPATPSATPVATATEPPTPASPTPTLAPAHEVDAPIAFRYDTYDLTGVVGEPGSYAFLADGGDPASVVTTYEGLRDGTTTALRLHTSDAHGASQAALYDAVETGHLIEWHKADDCFVRYRVTDVPEAAATATQREYGVRWETYVFQGCQTGSIPTSATVTFTAAAELPLEHLGGTNLTDFAVVHGPWQLTPGTPLQPNAQVSPRTSVARKASTSHPQPERFRSPPPYQGGEMVTSLAEARRLPYWRDPSLPEGVTYSHLYVGDLDPLGGYTRPGYEAFYVAPAGYGVVAVAAQHMIGRMVAGASSWLASGDPPRGSVREPRVIAGRPAIVEYSPLGVAYNRVKSVEVHIYDPATECEYTVKGLSGSYGTRGGPAALERVIAIAESLFEEPTGKALYDSYDTTGAVTAPGSYASLADGDDPASAVTTYEGLRDGTTTALRIHTSDAHGASQAALYDTVETGHLIEWHKGDDCFVRYRVTDVPEAAATATQREFGVRRETYVFQGCQTGSVPTSAAVTFTAAAELPLEHLGGTSLTDFAVVHGIMQLVPDGVLLPSGAVVAGSPVAVREPVEQELSAAARGVPTKQTSDLSEARRLPLWREPSLPESWRFASVRSGNHADVYGYQASYVGPAGVPAVRIQGAYPVRWLAPRASSWTNSAGKLTVREIRVIAGRPATVQYSPLGTQHHATGRIKVEIFDPATGSGYIVSGLSGSLGLRGGPDAAERVIAIACSLFWSADQCAQ